MLAVSFAMEAADELLVRHLRRQIARRDKAIRHRDRRIGRLTEQLAKANKKGKAKAAAAKPKAKAKAKAKGKAKAAAAKPTGKGKGSIGHSR